MSLSYDTDADLTPASNGRVRLRSLDDLDQRTRAARLARDLVAELERDLIEGGDPAVLSAAQRQLIRQAALLGAMTEDAAARWLERKPADLALFGTLVDRQRRLLESLGLNKPRALPRDVTGEVVARLRANPL